MSGAELSLAGVGKSFRGLRAVHDVSFDVPASGPTSSAMPASAAPSRL